MARSFYADEDEKYSTPGLPTITHGETIKDETKQTPSNSQITINKFGNLITTAPALQKFSANIRETTTEYYNTFTEKYEFYTGTAKSHFAMTVDRISDVKGKDEDFLPNICTVLTSTLAGSIVSRSHSMPIRFFTPVLFGSIALKYTLPQTYENVSGVFSNIGLKIENKYFPGFKETREQSYKQSEDFCQNVEKLQNNLWNGLVESVGCVRKSICSSISSLKKD